METASLVLSDESRILAGVLLLSLVTVETGGLYMLKIVRGAAEVTPFQEKLLMPGGFFFSSMGAGRTEPNRLIGMVLAGAVLLAVSLTSLGIGLLTA
jgi:hypothetical protein